MISDTIRKEEARSIITVACQMLEHRRRTAAGISAGVSKSGDECYVLLDDATRSFCQAVSEHLGERGSRRWTTGLPRLLYEHPEKCNEILASVESRSFRDLSTTPLHFV